MEKIRKIQYYLNTGKTSRSIVQLAILFMSLMTTSCSVIGGIFKAGMGLGIFIVVAIVIVIIVLFLRLGNKKNE